MRTIPKDGGATSSLWADTDVPAFETAPEPEADICIIGAGITGLTIAFELGRRRATRILVLDDGPIGGGETGRTTAHLASAVDDRYHVLEKTFGADGARKVAESHAMAIDYIEDVVRELDIDCDFERVDGYLIMPPGNGSRSERRQLERERAAAQRAGLTCERVDRAPLPFDTGRALRFANQAQLHPIRYLRALADAVTRLGVRIHTGVHVSAVEPGAPLRVQLEDGRTLLARTVVDATNGAFTSQLHLPLRQATYRTYVLTFAIPAGSIPRALYWDTDEPYHYVRLAPGVHGNELLIVGGNDHRVGQGHPELQWRELEEWTRTYFSNAGPIVARWSGQILEPADHIAHIGRSPELDNLYVASGDSGNGMTHGTIAGLMIPDLIEGRQHAWADLYDPRRSHLHSALTLVKDAVQSSLPYVDWVRGGDAESLDDIPHGEGAVIRRGLHLIAAYRDERGMCHLRSATCPHLRGVVNWNTAEKTWDCPCHGSRFDRYGRVLNGPSPADLAVVEPALERVPERIRPPGREEREEREERVRGAEPVPFFRERET